MLANKYPNDRDVLNVMVSLALDFDAGLQLLAYSKYLGLTHDALQPKPSLSYTLLGVGGDDGEEPAKVAVNLSSALTHLIKHALAPKMEDVFEANDEAAENANELFSRILEQTLALSTSTYEMPQVNEAVGSVLGAILGTLTLVDFVDTIEVLLNRKDTDLRVRVLWLLEGRLTGNERDVETQARVIKFLENLVEILNASSEVSLKKAALACITKVVDKYGKNHPDQVVATARVVAAPECLAHTEERLRIMSALCLASSVEVLGQAFIPVLPLALPRCFELLKVSVLESTKQPELHDAVYSFISALLVHIPWMITEDYLNNILLLSFKSAAAELPESSAENRVDTLRLLARKVDAEETFRAVEANWSAAVDVGFLAVKELLQVTTIAIEKHPKSATVKNLSVLTKILQKGFDIRRAVKASGTMETSEVNGCEGLISDIAIKMIYKLNDTIFRPVFVQLTEWAVSGLPKSDEAGRLLRLTTFYKFVGAFFGTLKSIVTSYSSYILESVVDTLKTVKSNDKSVKDLWLATMSLLHNSFEHDQDEFWQSPTHLNEIAEPLVNQLATSTSTTSFKQTHTTAVPVIVELATAAASPDNHKQINSFILRFMRTRGAENPLTRLAAVKCEQALTERLGEEWLVLLPEMLPYI
ncbi:snoRNA-binding rRNA-processing protein utp10, partial [Ascosphaera atra]